jgi:hypothetical protein
MPPTSDPNFDKEKPEGWRETIDQALGEKHPERQGATNKPLAEEERQQEQLPPRGQAKED